MRYAVVSDLHANREAFERVLRDAASEGVDAVVCLGDVVGYGPLPAETLALARERAAVTLAGNHDDAVSGRADAADFIELAGEAAARHREALKAGDLAWLRELPYTAEIEGAVCAHGDFVDPAKFYYIDDEEAARQNFEAVPAQLMFVGHTHVPGIFLTGASGSVYSVEPTDFTVEEGKRYIVNPGSVGYPREANGECRSSYVVYDSAERTVRYRYLPFSVASVMQRGRVPRRRSPAFLVSLVLSAAVFAGAAVLLLAPKEEKVVEVKEVVEVREDPSLALDAKTVSVGPGDRFVRANLELAKGSAGVQLKIVYRGKGGRELGAETLTVKKSSRQRYRLAEGTVACEVKLARLRAGEEPVVARFAPETDVR